MPIAIDIQLPDYAHVQQKLNALPRQFREAFKQGLNEWFDNEFLQTMDDIIMAKRSVPEVPPVNQNPYATMKLLKTGIGHSLGEVPRHRTGSLPSRGVTSHGGALRWSMFTTTPKIIEDGKMVSMVAEMPTKVRYAHKVHEGGVNQYGAFSKPYRFWDGAFNASKDKIGIYIERAITRNVGV